MGDDPKKMSIAALLRQARQDEDLSLHYARNAQNYRRIAEKKKLDRKTATLLKENNDG